MPPEFHSRDKYSEYINFKKHDVWAIGIIAYEITCLKHPFDTNNSL